jgi:fatty-acyl-CoA synthase
MSAVESSVTSRYIPLTPLAFLERAEAAFAERVAVVDGRCTLTYRELADRSRRLGGMLEAHGVRPGDRVAALCLNGHAMLELHYGVPLVGAVLVPINVRLSVGEVSAILEHSGARVLVVSEELIETAAAAAAPLGATIFVSGRSDSAYEIALRNSRSANGAPVDENGLIAINYTSGSTGRPKGVMYSHRGAYLQSLAMAGHFGLRPGHLYLWTLPMFHCNGWCFTWAVTAGGATHVSVPRIDPAQIWKTLCEQRITHLSGAPTVLLMIAEAADQAPEFRPAAPIDVSTGGAPPSPALLERLSRLSMRVTHLYGLTETYGPCVINQWQPEWSSLPEADQSRLNARQGVGNMVTNSVDVVGGDGRSVPADGKTIGEIVVRGNNVMLGYYLDSEATVAALGEGFLRTGDLGVRFADGYVELKDRSKDIIVTGGENVSSVEVEQILAAHPAVLEAAVIARPDPRWGETPVAVVTLRAGAEVSEKELIEFVRAHAAHFKAPKLVVFGDLPKTSTGKVQKHLLRERVPELFGEALGR